MPDQVSKQLTPRLLQEADLTLTMEERYENVILLYYPQFKNKIFTLKEFTGEMRDLNIKDPYGQDFETYEKCAEEIKSSIGKRRKKKHDQ